MLERMSRDVEVALSVLLQHLRENEDALEEQVLCARAALANWLRGAYQFDPAKPAFRLPEDLVPTVAEVVQEFEQNHRVGSPSRGDAQLLLLKLDALLDTVVWDESAQPKLVLVSDSGC